MPDSHNYLFVSDLHLGAGRDPASGLTSLNEDFFHDDTFARLLNYYSCLQAEGIATHGASSDHFSTRPWKLIINGDLFDFIQIDSFPPDGPELLQLKGIELRENLNWREKTFGLGTSAEETVWKLEKIYKGHPYFFQALAWFVAHKDYGIVILKGNHDVELYWQDVQDRFRNLLLEAYTTWKTTIGIYCEGKHPLPDNPGLPGELSTQDMKVWFPPSFCYEKGVFYAEHGGQYDFISCYPNYENPTLPDQPELIQLPSGSLFTRYAFNKAEKYHPFAENLKPLRRYVFWLFEKLPYGSIRILFKHLPRAILRTLRKKFNDWRRRRNGTEPQPVIDPSQQGCSNPPMSQQFCASLPGFQKKGRNALKRASNRSTGQCLLGLLLKVVSLLASIVGLYFFIIILVSIWHQHSVEWTNYLVIFLLFIIAVVSKLSGSYLFSKADQLHKARFLEVGAEEICKYLKGEEEGPGAVPYYLFGHHHYARIEKLLCGIDNQNVAEPYWFIRTGFWMPEFDKVNPLQEPYKLTYFCLMPGSPGFGTDTPGLLEWRPEADRPRKARLFEEGPC